MALPANRIYLRSPYFVSLSRANLLTIVIEIYIYTGTLTTDKPADYQFRLASSAFLNEETGNKFAQLDISELARDYVEVDYSGTDVTNAVWVEYDLYYADEGDTSLTLHSSVELTGINGFGYFENGYNPDPIDHIMQSSDYVIVPTNTSGVVPVLQDYLTGYDLYDNTSFAPVHTVSGLTPTENTANVIYYASLHNGTGSEIVRRAVFHFSGGRQDREVNIRYLDECRYEAIKMTFVNRFGATQQLWTFAKSNLSIATNESKYKRNLLNGSTYDTKRHQLKTLSKNGVSSISVNTGFYPENSNATFNEIMLSEDVWAEVPSQYLDFNEYQFGDVVIPVNIKNSELTFKTSVNDGPINYSFNLEFASDRINTVR